MKRLSKEEKAKIAGAAIRDRGDLQKYLLFKGKGERIVGGSTRERGTRLGSVWIDTLHK